MTGGGSDAWDQLREELGPRGLRAAQALLVRIRAHRRRPGWECSLHLAGNRERITMAWIEPAERIPLTDDEPKAQNL